MASQIINLADELAAALSEAPSGTWSVPIMVKRSYVPIIEHTDSDLHVTIVPRSVEVINLDRSRRQFDYQLDLAVQQHGDGENFWCDGLMELVEELIDWLAPERDIFTDAIIVAIANQPVYSPEHLSQYRTFTSVLTLTVRMWDG